MNEYEIHLPRHDWNYFLALDDDVCRLSRFLELTAKNFASYSLELARILFVAASEVDVVSKGLCKKLDKNSKAYNIEQYRKVILSRHPVIRSAVVEMPRYGIVLKPWERWEENVSPDWWIAYNKVKHRRNSQFFHANLENALNAIAGLFVLLLFLYKDEAKNGELNPAPVLFRVGTPFFVSGAFLSDYPATIYLQAQSGTE